ncbi:MAG TPA: hypothetical protein VK601_10020, partial [Kofleriaceae bacterium]|nr:hypothetical protein [Kofleriaceae bacterium]
LQEQELQAARAAPSQPSQPSQPASAPSRPSGAITARRAPAVAPRVTGAITTPSGAPITAFDREDTAEAPRARLRPPALELAELFRSAAAGHEAVVDGAEREPVLDPGAIQLPEDPQLSPDDSDVVMLSYEQLQPVRSDEDAVDLLLHYEREIAASDPAAGAASLRIEAGRLSETLGDAERARGHYEAALVADRGATAALRGLRRIARAAGDAAEMIRLLDAELAVAGPRERGALLRYRIDLLMAQGEQDLARVAVGELLDAAPADLAALLAHLELALLDDRAAEFAAALERLAGAVTDPALRAALHAARAALATHQRDAAGAASWAAAAAEADPGSPAARLAAIHRAVAGDRRDAGTAYLDLACHLEAEDPLTAAALAVRAQLWTAGAPAGTGPGDREADRETMAAAAQLAARAAPRDPLVARIATDTALAVGERAITSHAFARWARCAYHPVERAYAAARAAELEPGRLGRLWAQVLEHDPGDDYAAARLRALHAAAGDLAHAIELDLQIARDTGRDAPVLRAAAELLGDDQGEAAIELLARARDQRPGSAALGEALGDALAEAGRWSDRARLLGELAAEPGALARDVARLRAALAWERAARAAAAEPGDDRGELRRATLAALDAWDLVLDDDPGAALAHAARLALAARLGDPDVQLDALARTQAAERSPWAAASLALRRAQLLAASDPRLAEDIARDAGPGLDDPRRTLIVMLAAARRRDLDDAATALDDRAALLEAAPDAPGDSLEPATLRLRAALLALDADDPARARALLARVDQALPGMVDDLIDAARRRAGDTAPGEPRPRATSFVRALRDAELAAARGRPAAALELYQRALAIRPTDPLAAAPLIRIAVALRDPQPIAALALEQLRTAEAMADAAAKAEAYELLARAEELRGDAAAAQIALEAAVQADPARIDLLHRLERELAVRRRHTELLRLRERQIEQIAQIAQIAQLATDRASDLAALIMDAAVLAVRAGASEPALARLYRAALDADPEHPRAALHLEAILRRTGASEDLAALYDHIAAGSGDPATRAAFLVRTGEALAALGKPADAIVRFARACEALPGYLPALEAWQHTALGNKLWRELAEVMTRRASLGGEPRTVAALHHFAGVALMDKAHAAEPAIAALRRALELEPGHVDSFVRLRILLEHTGSRDGLAALLRKRLEIEPDRAAQVELHRLLAEHWCTVGDRDAAMQDYRAVLKLDPADVRAHAAIADLASEHAGWQAAVSAVMARVPLEREPSTLRTLHYRLGVLYADHDVASALSAFQRALTFRPGDKDALTRISELAMTTGKWQLALDACNRLVTTERDPEKLAVHLHRAAAIFAQGFGDRKRAERMLELAFDSAPTSTEGLRLLVKFYQDAGDPAALRAQLLKITTAMRARIAQDPGDGPAYRILARAIAVRAEHIVDSSLRIARAAAE